MESVATVETGPVEVLSFISLCSAYAFLFFPVSIYLVALFVSRPHRQKPLQYEMLLGGLRSPLH